PFDRIHDADYQPAVEEGMRRQLAEVEGIASDTAAPSFDNTIVALERSGALLTRAFKVFIAMTQANTDDTLQRIQTEEAPRLAAHLDAIHLNDSLFRRVRSVYERRRYRRRRRGRAPTEARRQMGTAAAEHHPAAGAGVAQEPGRAAATVHRVDDPRRAGRLE